MVVFAFGAFFAFVRQGGFCCFLWYLGFFVFCVFDRGFCCCLWYLALVWSFCVVSLRL